MCQYTSLHGGGLRLHVQCQDCVSRSKPYQEPYRQRVVDGGLTVRRTSGVEFPVPAGRARSAPNPQYMGVAHGNFSVADCNKTAPSVSGKASQSLCG